jgi:hypothetical protein
MDDLKHDLEAKENHFREKATFTSTSTFVGDNQYAIVDISLLFK